MKLVMIVCVRDEKDIISQNIRFHVDHGVDQVLVLDNGSVDGTRDLLADLEHSHPVTVLDEPDKDHAQGKWMTRLAHLARDTHGADWILPNDADEFWWPGAHSLKDHINRAIGPADITTLKCHRKNLFQAHDTSTSAPWNQRLVYTPRNPVSAQPIAIDNRLLRDVPHFYSALPGKILLRAQGLRTIDQGNHHAEYETQGSAVDSGIVIFHYPIRSHEQFVFKTLNGGEGYAQNTDLPLGTGWHKRRWYWLYRNCGLTAAIQDAIPSEARLTEDLTCDVLEKDETLVKTLDVYAS